MKWRPKKHCACLGCGWHGKRAIVFKPCPDCGQWKVKQVDTPVKKRAQQNKEG